MVVEAVAVCSFCSWCADLRVNVGRFLRPTGQRTLPKQNILYRSAQHTEVLLLFVDSRQSPAVVVTKGCNTKTPVYNSVAGRSTG